MTELLINISDIITFQQLSDTVEIIKYDTLVIREILSTTDTLVINGEIYSLDTLVNITKSENKNSNIAQWIGIGVTFLVALIALFGDFVKQLFVKLSIELEEPLNDLNTIKAGNGNQSPVVYYHLRVINYRKHFIPENVRVNLISYEKKNRMVVGKR